MHGGSTCTSIPRHSLMRIMWILQRSIRRLIRRKEGKLRGTFGKDASRGVGLPTPPPGPVGPHAPGHEWGHFARIQFVLGPPRRRFRDGALPGAATALDPAGPGQAMAASQGCCAGGQLGHCPGPAPTGVSALVRRRRPSWPQMWPSRRPNRPKRPAWEPPLRLVRQRLTSEMPSGQYKQQAPVLRLRYGACLFCLIFRSPTLSAGDYF